MEPSQFLSSQSGTSSIVSLESSKINVVDCFQTGDTFSEWISKATKDIHIRAVRTDIMQDSKNGTVSQDRYVNYLVDLLPIYEVLEKILNDNKQATNSVLAPFCIPNMYRRDKIIADIEALGGKNLTRSFEAKAHAERIEDLYVKNPYLVPAHMWVRYLGDCYGGQELNRALENRWEINEYRNVYNFSELEEEMKKNGQPFPYLMSFTRKFKTELVNKMDLDENQRREFVEEVYNAYDLSIAYLSKL